MRRYPMCTAEHVHIIKRMPRSYDMSRTHIMHKGVNRHVDVILRCSPKHWKKKKVRVRVIDNVKKNNYVKIRVNAKKGYVAVRKVINEKYEKDRKNISLIDSAKVIRYNNVSAANKSLIHDMKRQIALMAKKSANYIDDQLAKTAVRSEPITDFSSIPATSSATVAEFTDSEIKTPVKDEHEQEKSISSNNPYVSDYSKHESEAEFHELMESLEKSLDEAFNRYNIRLAQSETKNENISEFVQSDVSDYSHSDDLSISVTNTSAVFDPVTINRNSNGDFTFTAAENKEECKPTTVSPDNEEEYKPVTVFPDNEEEYKPVTVFPDNEEEYKPATVFPDNEEEYKPATIFPDNEEEYKPVTVFPDDEEEYKPVVVFPDDEENNGYDPAPVSPNKDEGHFGTSDTVSQTDNSQYQISHDDNDMHDNRESETFLSRTGDQIKKVIGIIRGSTSNLFSHSHNNDYKNDDVEITYSNDKNQY